MDLAQWWFVLIAVLFVGYFVLEGFDFGVGMLMPFVGRSKTGNTADRTIDPDTRRRVALNTIGPIWDGNEVWLITAGGALFAAFPEWYATMFSGFYLPLLLILFGLIVRVCAIEWRGKIDDPKWRRWCDLGIGAGSWIPAILWGVAFANIVRGVDIDADKQYVGGFFALLNPYALLGGITTALVFAFHGAVFLALKTSGDVRTDAVRFSRILAIPTIVVAGAFVLWTQFAHGKGWTWALVAVAALALVFATLCAQVERDGWAFVGTFVAIAATVSLLFASLFPNVMPSSLGDVYSLTIENASSNPYTLKIMTWAALIMTPVVVAYQGWTYWVFRKRLSAEQIPPSIGLSIAPEQGGARVS